MLDSLNEEHLRNRFSPSSTRVKLADYQYLKVYDAILLADYEAEKNEETQAEKRDSIRLRSFASSAAYLNTLRYLKKRELLSKEADSLKFLVLHTYPAQKNSSEVLYPVRSESMAIPLHH